MHFNCVRKESVRRKSLDPQSPRDKEAIWQGNWWAVHFHLGSYDVICQKPHEGFVKQTFELADEVNSGKEFW